MSDTPRTDEVKRYERFGIISIGGGVDLPIDEALAYYTDERCDAQEYSTQTVIDLVRELRWLRAPLVVGEEMIRQAEKDNALRKEHEAQKEKRKQYRKIHSAINRVMIEAKAK